MNIGDNTFLKRGKAQIFGNKSDNQITIYDREYTEVREFPLPLIWQCFVFPFAFHMHKD
jgi:hypothetical protein